MEELEMRYMFASDIHGSVYYCNKMLEAFKEKNADRLVLLGDLLYHGPRNDLPLEYNPKQVLAMLNEKKDFILAVRGNCEAEVDQMVLEFPVMADYMILVLDEITFFVTHGHLFDSEKLPPMREGDVFIQGHTHILHAERIEKGFILNPGSVSIPKNGNPPTYAIYEKGLFEILNFEGQTIRQIRLKEKNKPCCVE